MKRFRLSIDDFGTGHSSLSQLRDIAFDELKIDRSFVHGALHDRTARAMYDASLGLGRKLGMEVVAEGVEDGDDWELLHQTAASWPKAISLAGPCLPPICPTGSHRGMSACVTGNWVPSTARAERPPLRLAASLLSPPQVTAADTPARSGWTPRRNNRCWLSS